MWVRVAHYRLNVGLHLSGMTRYKTGIFQAGWRAVKAAGIPGQYQALPKYKVAALFTLKMTCY